MFKINQWKKGHTGQAKIYIMKNQLSWVRVPKQKCRNLRNKSTKILSLGWLRLAIKLVTVKIDNSAHVKKSNFDAQT